MSRLTTIDPATATGHVKEVFDGALKGKHFNIFKAMANSPAALDAYVNLSGAVAHGGLTAAERELIQLTVGQANQCDYCVAAHTLIGKMSGLTDPQTLEARRGSVASNPKYDALAKFTLAIHEKKGHVSDDDVKRFKAAGYADGHVAEVVANYALATYTNYFNHVNNTAVDFPHAPKL